MIDMTGNKNDVRFNTTPLSTCAILRQIVLEAA